MKRIPTSAQGIAIVTGASSGIGAAFARHLAAAAAEGEHFKGLPLFDELWLVARRQDRLSALAEELQSTYSETKSQKNRKLLIRTFPMDLVQAGSIDTLANRCRETGKPLEVLINNAGYGSYGPFAETSLEKQLGEIDLNCRALTESCGKFAALLREGSLVINVASLAAFAPLGDFAVYAATKAYVFSFSVALATEWKNRGIRVHALCPGPVQSEFAKVASDGVRLEVAGGYSAEKTTYRCLKAAAKGKLYSIPRLSWRIQRLASLLVGPVISADFARRFLKRPYKKR
ncbi:MAG: SDR family NAD(P)-dependent oxidoreductase [Treponemataceae bacterium]|nr:SDR family NAD(P)-dependent oxidoreductase [Treponemataceae bacterium]